MAKSSIFIFVLAATASLINATLQDCSQSSSTWGSCDTDEEKSSLLQTNVKKETQTQSAASKVEKDNEINDKEVRKVSELTAHVKKETQTQSAASKVKKDNEIAEKEIRKLSELTAHVKKEHQRLLGMNKVKKDKEMAKKDMRKLSELTAHVKKETLSRLAANKVKKDKEMAEKEIRKLSELTGHTNKETQSQLARSKVKKHKEIVEKDIRKLSELTGHGVKEAQRLLTARKVKKNKEMAKKDVRKLSELTAHVKKETQSQLAASKLKMDKEMAKKEMSKLYELTLHVEKETQRLLAASKVKKDKEMAKKDMKQNIFLSLSRKWSSQAETVLETLMVLKDLPEANESQVTQMGEIVESVLLPGLLEAHNFSQMQLDEADARLDKCFTDGAEGVEEITPLETITGEAKFNHTECREAQVTLRENMTEMCDLLQSYLTNTLFPDIGFSPELIKARADLHEYEILVPEFKMDDRACNESTALFDEKVILCDGYQAAYQSDFCEYRQALLSVASEYDECYEHNKQEYTDLYAELQEQVVKWRAEYTSIKKIECYLQVWLADANPNTVNATTAAYCEEHVPDTSVMDIHPLVLELPNFAPIDTGHVEFYPGTPEFPSVFYTNPNISYNHDIPACISETLATPAPTLD
jgi:hypothetical protein